MILAKENAAPMPVGGGVDISKIHNDDNSARLTLLAMAMSNPPSGESMLDWALHFAGYGFPIFPVRQDNKRPLVPWGGLTTEPNLVDVRQWWSRWPNAMIGLPTGARSGVTVLDVDCKNGNDGFATMRESGWQVPEGLLEVRTATGGAHFYFPYRDGQRNNEGVIGVGIDTRAEGGFIVLPPSMRSVGRYEVVRGGDVVTVPFPAWAHVTKARSTAPRPPRTYTTTPEADQALAESCERLIAALPGTRNRSLNIEAFLVGQIVGEGKLDEATAEAQLTQAAIAAGLDDDEIAPTIASGLKGGMAKPRRPVLDGEAMFGDEPVALPPYVMAAPPSNVIPFPSSEARQSRFFSASTLAGKPVAPRDWVVPDMVPGRTVTLFSGDGGTGKSLLALQLAVAVAGGRDWIGKQVKPGKVVYISAEDDEDELHRRLNAIIAGQHLTYADVAGLTLRSLAGEDALLAGDGLSLTASPLFKELETYATSLDPVLIVLDTLADLYPANENDRAKVRQFVGILRGLALRTDSAVLMLSHPSLTGMSSGTGASGSTAWNNSVRSRLYLQRKSEDGYEADPDVRTLTVMKSNYGRTGGELTLKYLQGAFWPQAVAAGSGDTSAKAERVFLKLLGLFTEQGRYVNAAGGQNYAPKVFSEHRDAEGVTKRALRTAMDALLTSGAVVNAQHGTGTNARSHLEINGNSHDN